MPVRKRKTRVSSKNRKEKPKIRNVAKRQKKQRAQQEVRAQALPQQLTLGHRETEIEKVKFSTPDTAVLKRAPLYELPQQYGKDRLVLQVRDPWWIHAYWELTPQTLDRFQRQLHEQVTVAKRILRVYDVSHIIFNGSNAHRFFDIEVGDSSNNWYIDTQGPGRSWCVEYGLLLPDGRFIMIMRSNTVHTPLDGPSWITDEEWMIPDDEFFRLYGMGFGFGKSSPVGKDWKGKARSELFSGILSSGGLASQVSPVKKAIKPRKFWLVVNTELIVYGATEPDAKVTIQGKEVALRADGTFSCRFALSDTEQRIPVTSVSNDTIDKITITPIVRKETK